MNSSEFPPESLGPQENLNDALRIENDILKLKLQAEHGARFGSFVDLSPQMEHEFLKMVSRFEEDHLNARMISVHEFLGCPPFKNANDLTPAGINQELERFKGLMDENGIELVIVKEYEPQVIYQFITEELFIQEIEDLRVPGMVSVFCYENFHPHPSLEIETCTNEFMQAWEKLKTTGFEYNLADYAVIPDGRILDKQAFIQKYLSEVDLYERLEFFEYKVENISYEWKEDHIGLGYSEGVVKYLAHLKTGNAEWIEGSYKLYFCCNGDVWTITFFYFPGFSW